jgi:oligopeptide/dipeptide ABC transporter ATP-binding protein
MRPLLLEARNIKKYYPVTAGVFSRHAGDIKAVDGVSFTLLEGETLGLVGESGCGKSTLGRVLLRLEEPTAGKILYRGQDIALWSNRKLKNFRKEAQMIFQDPQSSLDPRMTIGGSIEEALSVLDIFSEKEREAKVAELLQRVGLEPGYAARYPHEMSGGQKQRIGIARALAVNPKLIVADEPVSALDVSVQAQILNLVADLQRDLGLAYLFVAHDLAVIGQVSQRVAVMYLGQIIELAERNELFSNPLHPYTQALIASSAIPNPHMKRRKTPLKGEVPSPLDPPPGCHFHPRCPRAMEVCRHEIPPERTFPGEHYVACYLYG